MTHQDKSVKFFTPGEVSCIESLFTKIDANGDGELTCEEMVESLYKVMGNVSSKAQIEQEVNKFIMLTDTNKNGTIDIKEFLNYLAKSFKEIDPDWKLRKAFAMFDEDNDNEISHAELKRALSTLGMDYSDKDIKRIISKVDKNGDGVIDFEEFKEMMSSAFEI